ncbi:MAG TPA: YidB family protein [Prosthecobacter sp.]|nr:YidB family protein [Prosthecobacter sp.]HRK13986.1 YidB family protein [Prosthecobacter sp.]
MGLFDTLAKQALGGGNPGDILSSLLKESGGLDGLREKFQDAGLGEAFASWVGGGDNHNVQPAQIRQALGDEALQRLAGKLGFNPQMLLPLLSQFLPQVIDKLTPNGSIENSSPAAEQIQQVLATVMKNGLGGLFGRPPG